MQSLANGDWFVGWGQEPFFSEFGPEGQLLFEAHLPQNDESYRDFRFAWTGTPAHPPAFAIEDGGCDRHHRLRQLERRHARCLLEAARGRERCEPHHRRAGAAQWL